VDFVRHFGSARPYGDFAKKYRENGWKNPIPLPAKKKGPPPKGTTGHNAPNVNGELISHWIEREPKNNIGLRLHSIEFGDWKFDAQNDQWQDLENKTFDVIGIDIDEHPEEDKTGWSQYLTLAEGYKHKGKVVKGLGPLPNTWTSSARSNSKAGIRFFLAPSGLYWRGDCGRFGSNIDVISPAYRFAVVFPSFHPKAGNDGIGQYLWYAPGFAPDGQDFSAEIPKVKELPLLPDSWVEFLTQGYIKYEAIPMDMTSSYEELKSWATVYFANHKGMCKSDDPRKPGMEDRLAKRLAELNDSEEGLDRGSHPLLTKVHYEFFSMGSVNGHTGWMTAIKEFENAWRADVLARHKRTTKEADSEIERSRTGALRKLKGKWEEFAVNGNSYFKDYDPCIADASPNGDCGGSKDVEGAVLSREAKLAEAKLSVVGKGFSGDWITKGDNGIGEKGGSGSEGSGKGKTGEGGGLATGGGFPRTKAREPGDYELNDDGNAKHFLDLHKGYILWIPNGPCNWLLWYPKAIRRPSVGGGVGDGVTVEGGRWRFDEIDLTATLFRRVKERQQKYAKKLTADYMRVKGQSGSQANKGLGTLAKRWENWANRSGFHGAIKSALSAAKSVRGGQISVLFEELDADRRVLGCNGQVIKIERDGQISIMENSRELLITKDTHVKYLPLKEQRRLIKEPGYYQYLELSLAEVENLERGYFAFRLFLKRFRPMDDLGYFQKLCGSVLLGDTPEKAVWFFWGEPDSGKTTMIELLRKTLGDYACARSPDIFKSVHLNPALATALSMRLMAVHEMGDNEINCPLFKTLSGGDQVAVEMKGQNNIITDVPQFTVIVDTNTIPRVPNEDLAFRNRLRVIRFRHKATDWEKGKEGKKAQQELYEFGREACLAWLVEGASRYVTEGLDPVPDEIRLATTEFTSQLSDISVFVEECLVKKEGEFTRNEDIKAYLEAWLLRNNLDLRGWTQSKITQRLKDMGYTNGVKKVERSDGKGKTASRGFFDVTLRHPKGEI